MGTNDEYLQFMYERLILMRELLSEKGCIYVHCDWHKVHHLRCLLDEVFGSNNFVNEIVWHYADYMQGNATTSLPRKHDTILFYSKTPKYYYERVKVPLDKPVKRNRVIWNGKTKALEVARDGQGKIIYDEFTDRFLDSVWEEDVLNIGQTSVTRKTSSENLNYPTQKPKRILELIIEASSQPGDLVFDCFMGSGTTQSVAMKLGRRFIGADINLGAIQTTTKRLLSVAKELENSQTGMGSADDTKYTGFEVYNVNNYDFFRNPVEARDLLIAALEIQPFPQSDIWDGELDGRMVKIMPVNRIATKADLKELLANLPYKTYEKRKEENPNQPVERITIVCMGHEPDLKGAMEQELTDYKVDIQIMDILRDKADLQLKRDSEAEIVREGGKLVIRAFYPMNLIHSDLAKIKVCADPRGCGDPRCAQHIKDHGSSQFPRRHVIRSKVAGGVDHHLINGVDMDVLWGDVFEVDIVDLGADLDILCHPGRCYDIVNSQSRVRFQIHGICAFACKLSSGSMALPLRIDFSDPLYHFKKTGSAGYTISSTMCFRSPWRGTSGFMGC